MAESLQFGHRDDQVLAARGICKLNSKQKLDLAENGVIIPLFSMLQFKDYESTEAALYGLLNLAFGTERNKVRIVQSGAIPAVLKVLQWGDESLLELALALLLTLSSCSANKPKIASSGAVQLLFELLGSGISYQSKFNCISTLHNLAASIKTLLSDGLISLIQLICVSDKSSEIAEKAIDLLESLVTSSETALNQVSEIEGVIGMLVAAVEDGTAACKEHAVVILVKICKSCRERYRGMILSEGVVPGLMQLSVDGNRRARDMAKALLMMLRDGPDDGESSPSSSARSILFEEVMRRIDRGGRAGSSIKMVEAMIAKLRT
ncbi:U-box domain-containing protein 4 [Phtheirospermum japonicum]|uniref:U-box domain-containing protein 4 n=1 Tax=Phtheirospermum japonicum TaxID=374723 RepID=A0A830D1K3_9LAMI|nr:U-box domain-containing protein 4 [Phtheirospermum japonicum]